MNRIMSFGAALRIVLARRLVAKSFATMFVSLQWALWAQAGSIVVPGAFATNEGVALNRANVPPTRAQQLCEAAEFSSLGGPVLITGYMARPHALQSGPAAVSGQYLDFWMSTTSRTVSSLSPVFAENRGADHTLVASYDPAYVFTTENLPGPGNTKQFDVAHIFDTPFFYNPAAGNLLLELRIGGNSTLISGSEFWTSACSTGPSSRVRMVIFNGSADATAGQLQSFGEIDRFLYEPAADFNKDGDVDADDLTLWQAAFGLSADCDADGDGDTDGRDFLLWQRQYVAGVPGLAKELAIPEPAGLWLSLMALAGSALAARNTF